jgi:hypothetical protein
VAIRLVVAVTLFIVLAGVAWWLERRRRSDAPMQGKGVPPAQLDRNDFPRPDARWLVVLFTSSACDSCEGLLAKAAPLESADVAVTEMEFTAHRELHERYGIDAAPMTLIADAEGVVRGLLVGTFSAGELWSSLAELRESYSP